MRCFDETPWRIASYADKLTGFWTSVKALVGKGVVQVTERVPDLIAANAFGVSLPDYDGEAKRSEQAAQQRRQALLDALKLQEAEQDAAKEREASAERWRSLMDDALRLEKEAKDINERTRVKGLTTETRKAELTAEREKVQKHITFFESQSPEAREARATDANAAAIDAGAKKRLAEIDAELSDLSRVRSSRRSPERPGALAQQGIFLGERGNALVDINRQQLRTQQAMLAALRRFQSTGGGFDMGEFQ